MFRPDFVYKHSKAIFTQLGRPNFTFHNLRSTCVSILQEKEWTVKDCQEWLGHNDFQTTMNIYTHIAKRSQKEKAEKLDELFNL